MNNPKRRNIMCTAITFQASSTFFGRNLDNDISYNESITITPRYYPLLFRHKESISNHFAFIGMATVDNGYPLYYDATNEKGLSIAALNFPESAVYFHPKENMDNIASYELIPWLLSQCSTAKQAIDFLGNVTITNEPYNECYLPTPLHWFIADQKDSYVIESMKSGLNISKNPVGVLTNDPPFEYHIYNLSNYMNLTREEATNRFAPNYSMKPYSHGMGAIGLPGDLSSASRFIKAAFTKLNASQPDTESRSISQFFHILSSVAQQEGCVKIGKLYEKTLYTSCCDINKCIYYYTTYDNSQITGVSMYQTDINSKKLTSYPLRKKIHIRMENQSDAL